jgi:hypothetical protein
MQILPRLKHQRRRLGRPIQPRRERTLLQGNRPCPPRCLPYDPGDRTKVTEWNDVVDRSPCTRLLATAGYRVTYNNDMGATRPTFVFIRIRILGPPFADSRSWISCEEQHSLGQSWQVDPTGQRTPRPITLGRNGGCFESFAYDERKSHYFVTEDDAFGPLRRFIPTYSGNTDPWEDLFSEGAIAYLRLIPDSDYGETFVWIEDKTQASMNANAFYPHAEGIDVAGDELYFVSKTMKRCLS